MGFSFKIKPKLIPTFDPAHPTLILETLVICSLLHRTTTKAVTAKACVLVVSEMKIGNIVPRAGIEPTFLALWGSVLPLHHHYSTLPQRSVKTTTGTRTHYRMLSSVF